MNDTRECLFNIYCKTCKYFEKEGWEDPCDACLCETYNIDSHKPVNYKEDERKISNVKIS